MQNHYPNLLRKFIRRATSLPFLFALDEWHYSVMWTVKVGHKPKAEKYQLL
jgi:hypothetical protein